MYKSGNSSAVDARLFHFTFMHLGAITKVDIIISNVHRSLCSGTGVFKTYKSFMILRAIIGDTNI